ncbi:MAG: calcium/sodium antiporter [Patescibacteria group bacterium]|nr:calcium/sodium antiporter [Patescibacteria group bacterium]MDD5121003.1 calcium/sodium antiporter [Patescibacteria group bacterium]MDD5221636.1 calcium/sodium antiporter [Patescibacteria group bacterium]MDD5396078.1 calcium/sodium antiporter [Patescibacteria group bacterium]
MILNVVLLVFSFILLVKGADFLVSGASSLAKKLGVSTLVIGLTIVALGTSAPELLVNIFASIRGVNDIAFGNIIGSNILNLFLILGLSAAIFPLAVNRGTTWKEVPLALLATLVLGLLVNDQLIDKNQISILSRIDSLILLCFFIIFIYYTLAISKNKSVNEAKEVKTYNSWPSVLMVLGGLVMLVVGGNLAVHSGTAIARALGASEALIGLTILAVGTSLPELCTSVVAAYKKNSDIAVGNIIGSNVLNILFILGLSGLIHPIGFSPILNTDLLILITGTILLLIFLLLGKRHILERWQGMVFVAFYVVYAFFIIHRG